MPDTTTGSRNPRVHAPVIRDSELIKRAAKRTDWAGAALESAAGDLDEAHGVEGNALTGLTEVVLDEAARVSHLAEDIESHDRAPVDGTPGNQP
jgi:hypothetical protein